MQRESWNNWLELLVSDRTFQVPKMSPPLTWLLGFFLLKAGFKWVISELINLLQWRALPFLIWPQGSRELCPVAFILASPVLEEGATHRFLEFLCDVSVARFSFKVEELLAPRTRLNISSISICLTRTVFLIPGLFFDLYWSRTPVFSCISSV